LGIDGNRRLRFGDYELDIASGKLFRDNWPVKIQPQPLRVLRLLLDQPGAIVSRDELRTRIWGGSTFVEFDAGLNYSIRQIRLALREGASKPAYIETLPKQGYRFIASVAEIQLSANGTSGSIENGVAKTIPEEKGIGVPASSARETPPANKRRLWFLVANACIALTVFGLAFFFSFSPGPPKIEYTQLTDFTDNTSAPAGPALSPDGRMLAFFQGLGGGGVDGFMFNDEIYLKILPNGEPKRITNDKRIKYGIAFSPDGSQISYTVLGHRTFDTYTVSVLGGDSHLFLPNAAGLTWLNSRQLLFSRFRSGVHLGVVTATSTRENLRELYYPPNERAMAHYSFASPDRRSAIVVEMNAAGALDSCRLISVTSSYPARPIGPDGACTSAGWSTDGKWMYFSAIVNGQSHLWRQHFPLGNAQQLTFGPTEEKGIAMELNGHSLITALGVHESTIWLHGPRGERSLSSEGQIVDNLSQPRFRADGQVLYYLLRHQSGPPGPELWRTDVLSGISETVFPGVSMLSFDISPDDKKVLYSTAAPQHGSQLWIASLDKSTPAQPVPHSDGEMFAHFGPLGKILFARSEGNMNFLERMNLDGTACSKVVPYPISFIEGYSPHRRWVMAVIPFPDGTNAPASVAIPVGGGAPRRICQGYCRSTWSSNGKFFFVSIEGASRITPGRSLAFPIDDAEDLPALPPEGLKPGAKAEDLPDAHSVDRAYFIAAQDPAHYAYVKNTVHGNLYRASLSR
jgi:DNA-binding winged helix-turn-helix (wHTH) protein/Tol biopolymer transport system component